MKKIAFISPGYLPLPAVKGGAVETLIDILLNSCELNENMKVDIFSIESDKVCNFNKNVNYKYIKKTGKFEKILRYLINKFFPVYIGNGFINKIVKNNDLNIYDYVVIENKPEYGLYVRKYYRGILLFHSHNDFLNKNTKFAKKILNCYDNVFCLSTYICNRVKEIDYSSQNKIKLLYNGIDNEKFNITLSNKELSRNKYGLNLDDCVFLYTGRLVKEKGILELVKAFNKINDEKKKLLIVGSIGYGKTTYDKFTNELKACCENNQNIIFTGYVEYKDIQQIYALADYGIVPSIWEEPFALTVVEHLASGHPVIITNSGAMPELVSESNSITIDKSNFEEEMINAINSINEKNFSDSNTIKKNSLNFSKEKYVKRFIEYVNMQKEE